LDSNPLRINERVKNAEYVLNYPPELPWLGLCLNIRISSVVENFVEMSKYITNGSLYENISYLFDI
jgi:hypothetical protein